MTLRPLKSRVAAAAEIQHFTQTAANQAELSWVNTQRRWTGEREQLDTNSRRDCDCFTQMSPSTLTKFDFLPRRDVNASFSRCWADWSAGSRTGVPLLSSSWPPVTKKKTKKNRALNHWMSWGHYYYTPTSVCVCVCVLYSPNQELGRPDSSWQGEASAVCVSLLLKPLAEFFQSSATVLRFCCWSAQAGGNEITPPNLVLFESVRLSRRQLTDANSADGISSISEVFRCEKKVSI